MIGVIPSGKKTFIIEGYLSDASFVEGSLYVDPQDDRIYLYSTTTTRSSASDGYFPIWDGKQKIISSLSNCLYYGKDSIIATMSKEISSKKADGIRRRQKRSISGGPITFPITNEDNIFTQCIKRILLEREYTLEDLVEQSRPKLSEKIVTNYCAALSKITFMRLDKWHIWLHTILHLSYDVTVYDGKDQICYYREPDIFDPVKGYEDILHKKMDPLKKLIRIAMRQLNIEKSDLRSDDVDEYTINNMMTIIMGTKSVSAQLFSRFMRMAQLSFTLKIYDEDKVILTYTE